MASAAAIDRRFEALSRKMAQLEQALARAGQTPGPRGLSGPRGPAGAEGDPGPAGADGADGAAGSNGADGSVWRTGSGAPSNGLGVNGDYYLDTATSDVYLKAAGTYGVVCNIKGATGATGAAGSNGTNGTNGTNGQDAFEVANLVLAADFTVTNAGLSDVTGMSFAVAAGTNAYLVELLAAVSANNTTGDAVLDLALADAVVATGASWGEGTHYNGSGTLTNRVPTAFASTTSAQGSLVVNNGDGVVRVVRFRWYFHATSNTTAVLKFGVGTPSSGRTATLYKGARLRVTRFRTE